jgi:cytochrome b pre-mRNA-processing protein 3
MGFLERLHDFGPVKWARRIGRKRDDGPAHRLYVILAGQSRQPEFYLHCGAPDTLDGRFDLLTLHLFLVLRRLSGAQTGPEAKEVSQQLFDVMFGDMDQSLREMGVGDLSVGKKIRSMSEAFYGRVAAYEKGLQAGGDAVLIAALERNLFRGNAPEAEKLQRLAAYVRSADNALARQDEHSLLRGELSFPAASGFF